MHVLHLKAFTWKPAIWTAFVCALLSLAHRPTSTELNCYAAAIRSNISKEVLTSRVKRQEQVESSRDRQDEMGCVRFEFINTTWTTYLDGDVIGDALFEKQGNRFVYRFWSSYNISPPRRQGTPVPPRPLKLAAGFDGENYWIVKYTGVTTYPQDIDTNQDWFISNRAHTVSELEEIYGTAKADHFLKFAPLHVLSSDGPLLDQESVVKFLTDKLPFNRDEHWRGRGARKYWYFDNLTETTSFEIWTISGKFDDAKPVCIKSLQFKYYGMWNGGWPYFFPMDFRAQRKIEPSMEKDTVFDAADYIPSNKNGGDK